MAPSRIRSTTTAHSSRSPRNLGNITPAADARRPGGRPGRCAAGRSPPTAATRPGRPGRPRPCRCRARASWWPRPPGSRPALSSSSISSRCSRLTEPWWARAISSPAISFSRAHSRSASRRELANTIVLRWARISSTQALVDGRPDAGTFLGRRRAARRSPRRCRRRGHVLDRDHHRQVERLRASAAPTIVTGRGAAEEPRDLVERADRRRQPDALAPAGRAARRARSSDSARCAPRFVPATAWTSSTMTVSTPRSASRACDVSIRNSDSGVVIRMSGGVLHEPPAVLVRRVAAYGSPRRSAAGRGSSRSAAAAHAGQRRAQVALDVHGERLERRHVEDAEAGRRSAGGSAAIRSSAHRNAARVLPDPVGATTRVSCPAAMASQAAACAAVGSANASRNQVAASGEKRRRGSASTPRS